MNICIYGASSAELKKIYYEKTEELGRMMGKRGHGLVFGGGKEGLMGAAARGVDRENGYILGIAPRFFDQPGVLYEHCTEFIFTENMRERKHLLESRSDATIVVPGGIGTYEEFFEILTLKSLGRIDRPIVLYNIEGYYDSMRALLEYTAGEKFMSRDVVGMCRFMKDPEEILDYEIGLYNADQPVYTGMNKELFSAPRIDNLSSVLAILNGLMEGGRDAVNVAAFFDHEEIGSRTKQGAGSMVLSMVLEKISSGLNLDRTQFLQGLSESMLLSVDVGHAFHPNYAEKMDPTNHSPLNGGFCIKEASAQSYATDCGAVAIIEQICMQEGIAYTKFFNRSDGTSGSTLGSIASSLVPVPTVDVGLPLLAMHSSRELMGVKDLDALTDMIRAYYTL